MSQILGQPVAPRRAAASLQAHGARGAALLRHSVDLLLQRRRRLHAHLCLLHHQTVVEAGGHFAEAQRPARLLQQNLLLMAAADCAWTPQ